LDLAGKRFTVMKKDANPAVKKIVFTGGINE
jgi:hypothetical protein